MEPINSERNQVYTRRLRGNNPIESVDWISAIPDSILGVILSFLPTEDALATSILSKRWRSLWRTVHNLDFSFDRYWSYVEDNDDANNKFVGFVNHVLFHLDSGVLNKFCLDWRLEFPDDESISCVLSQTTSWIKTVITRNVREISLSFFWCHDLDMPISLFSCDSLRYLSLEWICLSASSTAFCLPRLVRLYFHGVDFESGKVLEEFIRGCPVLNYLSIDFDVNDGNPRYIISSTSLRRLELDSPHYHKHLKLDVSSLRHLKLKGYMSVDFVQQKLCSLVEVKFEIHYEEDDTIKADYCNSIVDAVHALERAKLLTLSTNVMETLSCGTTSLAAAFKRLVKLKTSIYCCQWSSLQHFIQHSNNLEDFRIHKFSKDPYDESEHDHSNWTTPVKVPRCLSTSLKNVVLKGYCGFDDEREMIGYILKHGSALVTVKIIFNEDINGSMMEQVQEIRAYPRMSGVCNLEFFKLERGRVVALSG